MSAYPIVTRAYPNEYWESHRDEVLDTANELHDNKWSFRESLTLLVHGLRTRSLAATGGSVEQVLAQGAVLYIWLGTASTLIGEIAFQHNLTEAYVVSPDYSSLGIVAAVTVPILFLLTRSAGPFVMFIVVGSHFGFALTSDAPPVPGWPWIFLALPTLIALFVALRGDGRPVMITRTGSFFLVLISFALVVANFEAVPFIFLALAIAGTSLVAIDPRFFVSVALSFLSMAVNVVLFRGDQVFWLLIPLLVSLAALGGVNFGQRRVNRY